MRLGKCSVINFGSYAELDFDFSSKGLSLLHGPTGAGKSTIADIPCWILFGETAKGGAVDEIRAWKTVKGATKGSLTVTLADSTLLTVSRTRGKTSENDLYWTENLGEEIRGKDLSDTQKQLDLRLGVNAEVYQNSIYFHEFSASGNFFVSKAKNRRSLFEAIADLSFPSNLAERLRTAASERRKCFSLADETHRCNQGSLDQLRGTRERAYARSTEWELRQPIILLGLQAKAEACKAEIEARKADLQSKDATWEREKNQEIDSIIREIEDSRPQEDLNTLLQSWANISQELECSTGLPCPTCGAPEGSAARHALERELSTLSAKIKEEKARAQLCLKSQKRLAQVSYSVSPYASQIASVGDEPQMLLDILSAERAAINPYLNEISEISTSIAKKELEIGNSIKSLDSIKHEIASLGRLSELNDELRSSLLFNSVSGVEKSVNQYLDQYFDAEIRVKLTLEGSDSLKVDLQKSGYACTYTQLSKGQRGLLKLCFVISVMAATANRYGFHSNALFLDESLDGLDSSLKLKAFGLFQELSKNHESVFVIDHEEGLKQLFSTRYAVSLRDDNSELRLQD